MRSETFERVKTAIEAGRVHVSEHAYDEATEDELGILAVIAASVAGEVIEDYPEDPRGRSCLALVHPGGSAGGVHAVWGHDAKTDRAVLITVYRPDPAQWSPNLKNRRPKA